MNQKTYSILFCALLASTFAHEIRAKAAANPSFAAHMLGRAASPPTREICELVCEHSNSTANETIGLSIIVNGNITAFINTSANVTLVIDVYAHIVGLLSGNGAVFIYNIKTSTLLYISKGIMSGFPSIESYIRSLTTLTGLLKISGAVTITVATASKAILKVISGIVAALIGVEVQVSAEEGLQLLIAISIKLITLFNGNLKGFLELVGSAVLITRYNLTQLLNCLQGLEVIFGKISGGFAAVIAAGVVIDLEAIFNARNGIQILIIILLAIGAKIDVGKALAGILNDVEALLILIAQLGGNSNIGINGLIKVISVLIAFIHAKVTFEVLVAILILYLVSNVHSGIEDDSYAILIATLSVALEAVEKIGATKTLSGFVSILKMIIEETWTVKRINIIKIVKILIAGVAKGRAYLLHVLVEVLRELSSIIAMSISLPLCLVVLIFQISSDIGIQLLKGLGIAIDVSVGSGSIITSILKSKANMISLILHGDLYGLLISLPIIGKIIEALSSAISAVTNGEQTLKALFKASTLVQSLIKGIFQLLGNIYLGVSNSTRDKTKSMMENCTSMRTYFSLNVTTSVTIS